MQLATITRQFRHGLLIGLVAWLWLTSNAVAVEAESPNLIERENSKAGTIDWQFHWVTLAQSRLTNGIPEVEGYASLTSVPRGGSISLYVNTAEPSYTIEVFRLGWYGGKGGRLMLGPIRRQGVKQAIPVAAADGVRLVECNWSDPYVINVPTNAPDADGWVSGVYWVKLTSDTTQKENFIEFVVRDDERASTYLVQRACTTSQAYNQWGGVSLYTSTDTNGPARAVSFNRPYDPIDFNLLEREVQMLRFLEREGFDVSYCSSIDVHEIGGLLANHQVYLSVGHDEYWSWAMRQHIEQARDQGTSLGFFSANVCYWQVRFEASSTGVSNRTMVCYKTASLDPYATDGDPSNDAYITTLWSRNNVEPPEDSLVGVIFRYLVNTNMVIYDSSHWICAGAGLTNGSVLSNLIGDEGDTLGTNTPPGTALVAHSPCEEAGLGAGFCDATVYTAPSGADVFAAGTEQWAWGLDGQYAQPGLQQMTRNILLRLARCAPRQRGMVSWWSAEGNGADQLGRNNGSFPAAVSFAPGVAGQSFRFNGINQYMVVTNVVMANVIQSALSFDAWVWPAIPSSNPSAVFALTDSAAQPWCDILLHGDGRIQVDLIETNAGSLAQAIYLSAAPVVTFNQWQHLAIAADAQSGAVALYVNGRKLGLDLNTGGLAAGGAFPHLERIYISGLPGNGSTGHYGGLLDEVGLYGRVLDQNEALWIWTAGAAGRCGDVPALKFATSNGTNILCWPLGALGFTLESSTSLRGLWAQETNVTVFNGDQFQFVPVQRNTQQLFRLKRLGNGN